MAPFPCLVSFFVSIIVIPRANFKPWKRVWEKPMDGG